MNATSLQHATSRGSDGRPSVSPSRRLSVSPSRRRGITLVELMVVIAIIALVATIALPAFGPMLRSQREAEFVTSLNGLFSMAQIAALGKRSSVALRFERAFETHRDTGLMISAGREANWLDHQQARFLDFATSKEFAFIHDPDSKVHVFPGTFWVAPGDFEDRNLDGDLNNIDMRFTPTLDNNTVRYSPFDTFYIVFNGNGELTRLSGQDCRYRDRTQSYETTVGRIVQPMVDYPDRPTATSLVLYDRRAFEQVPATDEARKDFLRRYGRVLYLNRYNAAVVEGRQRTE